MPKYLVVLDRIERIAFEVEADSPEEADQNVLGRGVEVGSDPIDNVTVEVRELS